MSVHYYTYLIWNRASLVAQLLKKKSACNADEIQSLGQEDPLGKETVIHSSILAWEIPWTEKCGGLYSMGSPGLRCNLTTKLPPAPRYKKMTNQVTDPYDLLVTIQKNLVKAG